MKRAVAVVFGVAVVIGVAVQSTAASSDGGDVLKFDTMATVLEPLTGAAHPVRGIAGGGLPWELDKADGALRAGGRLDVSVEGLVLARRAPVPENMQGTNPSAQLRAVVSCLTPAMPDQGVTVATDPVPASPEGDARIRATVDLPEPCIAPVVFVTSPTGAWFAATGR